MKYYELLNLFNIYHSKFAYGRQSFKNFNDPVLFQVSQILTHGF